MCDSSATIRTSQCLGVQTYACLDCDDVWTSALAEPLKRGRRTEPRVAASARDMVAAMLKTPPPSIEELRRLLAKTRTRMISRTNRSSTKRKVGSATLDPTKVSSSSPCAAVVDGPSLIPLPIRCPKCESPDIMRTSEQVGDESRLCLNCEYVWTIECTAVGALLTPATPRPGRVLWELRKLTTAGTLHAELRDYGTNGVELQLLRGGAIIHSRRHPSRRFAVEEADSFRRDYTADGWSGQKTSRKV